MFEGPEIIVVAVVILLLFGSSKLPQMARSLGRAKAEFEEGLRSSASVANEDEEGSTGGSPDES